MLSANAVVYHLLSKFLNEPELQKISGVCSCGILIILGLVPQSCV